MLYEISCYIRRLYNSVQLYAHELHYDHQCIWYLITVNVANFEHFLEIPFSDTFVLNPM